MSLNLTDFKNTKNDFFADALVRKNDRKFKIMTGSKGLEILNAEMITATWTSRLDELKLYKLITNVEFFKLKLDLRSKDKDIVAIAKTAITLKENEFNF